MTESIKVHVEKKMGYVWITLPSKLDMENHQHVEEKIKPKLKPKKIKVVFDLKKTKYLYSSAIGILIRARNHILKNGGSIWLVNVSKKCQENLSIIKLDKIFPIFSTDLEFELSQDSIWKKRLTAKDVTFHCIHQVENEICYINLSGRMASTNDLSSFNFSIYNKKISSYLFDLSALEMIDSHGAFLLLTVVMELKKYKAISVAFGANKVISELFNLLGIDEHLLLYKNKKTALQALKRRSRK